MKCKYCNKEFKSETNFKKHSCEKMKRFYSLNHIELSFFKNFQKLKKEETEIEIMFRYIHSKYYKQIHDLSIWCKDMNVIDPTEYFIFLLRNNIHAKKWANEDTLKTFLYDYLRQELPIIAIQRSKEYLDKNNLNLDNISSPRLYLALKNGFISIKYLKHVGFDYNKVLDLKETEKNVLKYFLES